MMKTRRAKRLPGPEQNPSWRGNITSGWCIIASVVIDDDKRSDSAAVAADEAEPNQELSSSEASEKPGDGERNQIGPDAAPVENQASTGAAVPEVFGRSYDSLVTYVSGSTDKPAPSADAIVAEPEGAPADEEIQRKLDMIPPEPGVYLLNDKRRQGPLRRQGQVAALAGARVFPRRRRRALPGALPDAAGARLRHPGHAQREGSADPRKQPHQAVQAALQHPPQGRQILPERQGHQSSRGRASW